MARYSVDMYGTFWKMSCLSFIVNLVLDWLHFSPAGWKETLTVKFADGGNKKKNQSRQWIDRQQDVSNRLYREGLCVSDIIKKRRVCILRYMITNRAPKTV